MRSGAPPSFPHLKPPMRGWEKVASIPMWTPFFIGSSCVFCQPYPIPLREPCFRALPGVSSHTHPVLYPFVAGFRICGILISPSPFHPEPLGSAYFPTLLQRFGGYRIIVVLTPRLGCLRAAAFWASFEDVPRLPIFVGGLPANSSSRTLVTSIRGLPDR